MTLLSIVQRACARLGISQPDSVYGNTDDGISQLLWLAQEAGDDIARAHEWSNLVVVKTFTPAAAQVQVEPPATPTALAFDRFGAVTKIWDEDQRKPLVGPLSRDEWVDLLTFNVTGVDRYWIMIGGKINIYPAPEGTESFTYTYITKNWIRLSGGDSTTDVAEWTADTNEPLVPADLVVKSLMWRWKQAKGLEYAEDLENFGREFERQAARDRGPRVIHTSKSLNLSGLSDGVWPATIG